MTDTIYQYCCNRPDAIYQISISASGETSKATAKRISSSERSARYARVIRSADCHSLVYVSNRRGYEHNSCATLHKRRLPLEPNQLETDDVLVKEVRAPNQPGEFPGLFPNNPPSQCLLAASSSKSVVGKTYLVLATTWASRTTIILVDLEDGSVHGIGSDEITSYKLMSTDNMSRVIAVRSSTVSPPELVLGTLSVLSEPRISWTTIKSWQYRFQGEKHCTLSHAP